jgi:antitoxin MazE
MRIPVAVVEATHLTLNQPVEIRAENGRVIIEPATPSYTLADLLALITLENRHDDTDVGVPQGRELL